MITEIRRLHSPDGSLELAFSLSESRHSPVYTVSYKGSPLILESGLGLEFEETGLLQDGLEVIRSDSGSVRESWRPLYGERELIPDRYNSLTVALREKQGDGRQLTLEFRAYDEGIAFRYSLPEQAALPPFTIRSERSQFHFPRGCTAFEEHGAEGEYSRVPVSEIKPCCERPLTVVYPDGTHVALTEATLHDYSRMLLSVNPDNPWMLESALSGMLGDFVGYGLMAGKTEGDERVKGTAPFATPWRVLLVGDRAGELLERNYVILNLNEPCKLQDPSWIVPGKLIRDVTLSPEGSRACVDFAAEHGLQYVMLDWGWYGDPFDDAAECFHPVNEVWFYNQKPGERTHTIDIPELVKYGESKGIGILLYLDRRAVERQLDRFLPVFKEWGVKGVKFGFVNTGPQPWTVWLHDCIRRCAEYGLIVNVHDAYRTTGYSRTYPNLITVEGIRGNEHFPTARHNATLPFTRFVAGCGDYTICYYDARLRNSHAHQLAMSVIAYSPLHSIMWYDKPSSFEGEPEMEFFEQLPTVWSETKVLAGEIGEYAVIARRKGAAWFVGAITNEQPRQLPLVASFLEPGTIYTATVYADDEKAKSRTKVSRTVMDIQSGDRLTMALAASGGQALWIRPKG
ncbi:alpha-glucosidase [Paenibacillus sp. UNCCL117]|uniref:glycoside hydrolase family 97 protein n=1 Tax=unclassified Paenibacillus TaxID=185978 RepID=UPI00088CC8B9|nr:MULTISPECIES: glycoside hydrolase family 97 protein [unclassified Paenibacillus]SDD06591.1 alpha-glucosidase [Paenibacillus sp. cl123]SFW31657.1 alpha-glucosidase [Paenibacillus sp. UNCCL117]